MVYEGILKAFQKVHAKGHIALEDTKKSDFLFATSAPIVNPHNLKIAFYDVEGLYEEIPINKADAVFTTEENAILTFQKRFKCPVFHLPLGFDPETYKTEETEPDVDITFCGTLFDPRPKVLSWLDAVSDNYKIRIITPSSWRSRLLNKGKIDIIADSEWVPLEETIDYYLRSKIILCINRAEENKNTKLKNRTPGRSFGEAALNRCVFIDDSRDISKFFQPRDEIITYSLDHHGSDLRACLQFYLEEFEEFREEVAQAGTLRALKEHTWDHRVAILVSKLHKIIH